MLANNYKRNYKPQLDTVLRQLGEMQQMFQLAAKERNEARALALEILGHTNCECFQRRLPADHWLFRAWEAELEARTTRETE